MNQNKSIKPTIQLIKQNRKKLNFMVRFKNQTEPIKIEIV
jgi:hypothetical protein